ncbi:MAG: phosphocholine cytidylyltransferase family protein [archaeon]
MKAVILAAGRATRLLPLTKTTPQCLLSINNKKILERQIELLKKGEVDDIVVVTGHLSNQIEDFCKKKKVKTIFNPFYEVSGMAMSLWIAKEELKDGFLFLYSDILFDYGIIKNLIANKENTCLAIKKNGLREEAEKVIEKDGIVEDISKINTGKKNGEFIGLAKFSKAGAERLLDELNKFAKEDLNTRFIQLVENIISKGNTVAAYNIEKKRFIDIDFLEDLDKARRIFKD